MTDIIHPFLPYGRQHIDGDDINAVAAVLRGEWLTTGPLVDQFEAEFSARVGARHAVACSNGTTALHLAALGANLSSGQVAIVPAVTFQATASAVLQTGAEVVFADVDATTALLTPTHIEDAINRAGKAFPGYRVTAVLPVHMAGRRADMTSLGEVASRHGLAVIEDAAHALGTVSPNGKVGDCKHSIATTFSFHPVKTITTGEGGAVTTNDDQLAARMKRLRNHGIVREPEKFIDRDAGFDADGVNPWYYEVTEAGFNYRMTDIQCALGLSQLQRLDSFVAHRNTIIEHYFNTFSGVDGIEFFRDDVGSTTSWHLAVARIDFERFGLSRGRVMRNLAEHQIGSQVHYMPLYRHPLYRKRYGEQWRPGAEAYYARALSLPLHTRMTIDDADRVCTTLKKVLGL